MNGKLEDLGFDSLKKVIEVVLDVVKTLVYVGLIVLAVKYLKSDVVKYVEEVEKIRAARDVALELKNERVEASVRLIRFLKRLQSESRAMRASLPLLLREDEREAFQLQARAFRGALDQFMETSESAEISGLIIDIELDIDAVERGLGSSLSDESSRELRRNLLLLDSHLAQLGHFVMKPDDP